MRAHPQHLQTAGSCICRAGFIILTISVIKVRNSGGFLLTYLGVTLTTVKQCSLFVGSGSEASTRPISSSTRRRVEETVWGCSEFPWLKPGVCFTRGPGTYKQGHPGKLLQGEDRGVPRTPKILQIPSLSLLFFRVSCRPSAKKEVFTMGRPGELLQGESSRRAGQRVDSSC